MEDLGSQQDASDGQIAVHCQGVLCLDLAAGSRPWVRGASQGVRVSEGRRRWGDFSPCWIRDWPEKDHADEMGEIIAEVFSMKGKDGESLRQWAARSREVFDRCARKGGVKFPEEARGWVLLNCSGLSKSERAVVLARAQGDLKFDSVAQAMRSCYPELTISPETSAISACGWRNGGYRSPGW